LSLLATYSAASPEEAAALHRRGIRSAVAVGLPFALVLAVASPLVIAITFGDAFDPAAVVLAILAFRIPFTALSGVYTSVLIARGHQAELMRNNVIGAVVNVSGVLIAVEVAGIDGAAAVSVLAVAIVFALNRRSCGPPQAST
jgi:O-antigen/teichoic acid export membrane protein